MRKNDFKQLEGLSKSELNGKLADLEKSLSETKMAMMSGKVKNLHQVAAIRKDIARVMTVLRAKE